MGPLLKFLSDYRFSSSIAPKSAANSYWHPLSEEEDLPGPSAEEGNRTTAFVNKYERNKKNRERCIKKYKAICAVCGFDFSLTYGEIGNGYIHVHHMTPLHTLKGKARKVDPIRDMRPVCPNCHEMLHRSDPPYTIENLQEFMAAAKAAAKANQSSVAATHL
jgi:5-methylcytosine-specific restriction protein A